MVSKSFLYSNGFIAKSCTQALSFKSMTDTQKYKTRNRKHCQAAVKPAACALANVVNANAGITALHMLHYDAYKDGKGKEGRREGMKEKRKEVKRIVSLYRH